MRTRSALLVILGLCVQGSAWANSNGTFQADSNGLSGNNTGAASDALPGGTSSIAIGINAIASSPSGFGDSLSIGTDTSATNQDSIAIGAQTTASGVNTIAIGNNGTTASGDASVVVGVSATGSGVGSSVLGTGASVNSGFGSAFGYGASASAVGGTAVGSSSSVTAAYGTALGFDSIADRSGLNGNEAFSNSAVASPFGALSIGQPGDERQITNVAGGTQDTDAVNVRQLRAVGNNAATALGGGSGYDNSTNAYTAPSYTVAGQTYHDVGSAMSASNNLAVQYTADNNGNPTNAVDLTKGGQLNPVSVTGLAPATTSSGAVSLSQLPLQYSTGGAPTTANPATASNDVTLIGTGGNAVTLHNVAPGALTSSSTDAVDGQQLYATNQNQAIDAMNIASLRSGLDNGTEGLVQQNPATQAITVGAATGGTIVDFTNSSGNARNLTGVAAGMLSSTSTDATNGAQLYATNQQVASLEAGTAGLVQQNVSSRNITVGSATDGTNVDLTNVNGATRSLSGVSAGALSSASTQAVNGSQLYATNQAVAGLESGSLGLVQQNATTRDITVGANTDGTDVNFANASGTARTLSNVAAGQIAAGSTQAINGGQAYNTAHSAANDFGGGAVVNPDGTVSAPSYTVQGTTYNNVGGALGGLDSAVNTINTRGSKYFAVNTTGAAASATGADTVAIGPNASATADQGVALGANSLASRGGLNGAHEMFSGTSVASTAGAVSVGSAGAERQIINVAGGVAPTDAVNVRQLTAVGQQVATVLGGGASLNANGTLNAPTYNVDGRQYADVGGAVTALDNTGVKYDVDPVSGARTNSISLQGGDPNQPVLIKNVASGQAAGDAANTGQVATARAQAMAYTDSNVAAVEGQIGSINNQLASLQTQVDQNRREARQGAAIGLAAASLRYDERPGKLSTSFGAGLWKGETATALGIGYTLPNGWARLNANGVTTGRDFGIGAGASFTLN